MGVALASGVTRAWYTDAGLLTPVALLVVACALMVAGEVNHYQDADENTVGQD